MRFVILEHRQIEGVHWDLLLDWPGAELESWRLSSFPPGPGWRRACRLADHRRVYLNYEGPISGSRGSVRRVDRGNYRRLGSVYLLAGALVRGRVEFCKVDSDWRARFRATSFDRGMREFRGLSGAGLVRS